MSIETTQMSTCIYCMKKMPTAEFNIEHVVQRSMSRGFTDNLTLHERVCRACNSYFDKELDLPLGRHSWHAVDRLRSNLKPLKVLQEVKGKNFKLITGTGPDSDLPGEAEVDLVEKDGDIGYQMRAHLVIPLKSGAVCRLYKEDLENRAKEIDFENISAGKIKVYAENDDDEADIWNLAQQRFEEKGRKLEYRGDYIPGTIPVFAEITFDEQNLRAFAKIAFNYLAAMTNDRPWFALNEGFNEIRKFIRYAEHPTFKAIEPIGNVGRSGMFGQEVDVAGHVIDLDLTRTGRSFKIVSRVTLFNRFGWEVLLCPRYQGLALEIDYYAHHWNLENRKCEVFPGGRISTRH